MNSAATTKLQEKIRERLTQDSPPMRAGEIPDLGRESEWLAEKAIQSDDPDGAAEQLVSERLSGTPLARLVGREHFFGAEFATRPEVLIPHPATEHLVALALDEIEKLGDRPVTVIEFGAGSGAIAITLARLAPNVTVYASDVCDDALELAASNASKVLGKESRRVHFLRAKQLDEVYEPFVRDEVVDVDLVVANPPYLIHTDKLSVPMARSGVRDTAVYAPGEDPSWFFTRAMTPPETLFTDQTRMVVEFALHHLEKHTPVIDQAGWSFEVYDRYEYLQTQRREHMRDGEKSGHRAMIAHRRPSS